MFGSLPGALFFLSGCGSSIGNSSQNEVATSGEEMKDYRNTEMTPPEFMSWFKNESIHLRKSINENNLNFTLEYRPNLYLAIQELQSDNFTRTELDTALKNYEGLMQFKLEIEDTKTGKEFIKSDAPDGITYEERVKYYAFEMQKDISLVSDGDTTSCSMYHFERSFGASPKSVFLIGFAEANMKKDFEIIIYEKVFTNKKLKFGFTREEITNLPQLKTL